MTEEEGALPPDSSPPETALPVPTPAGQSVDGKSTGEALPAGFRSGYVAVLGVPNVGKSTLVNALVGRKVAAVSPRPQTTRRTIMGVRDEPGCQIVFVDTPGLARPENRLGKMMVESAAQTARTADLVLYVMDASHPEESPEANRILRDTNIPIILVLNKVDLVPKPSLLPQLERLWASGRYLDIVPAAASKRDGTDILLKLVRQRIPEGPRWYGEKEKADAMPQSVLIQEIIQEKVFVHTKQEVPYSCGVMVEGIEREGALVRVIAAIIVEREAHKPILIGKGGRMISLIGTEARVDLQEMFGAHVYLDLRVKVEEDWREREAVLSDMGYLTPSRSSQ